MRYWEKSIGIFWLMAIFSTIIASGIAFAQYGYGTSSISLNTSSTAIAQGSSGSVSYTVNLASGSTWGTTISVTNLSNLTSSGISITLSKTYADPPYSGTATITVSQSTAPGNYNIVFAATGDDPSSSPSTLVLTVTGKATTTAPASTTAPATSTAPSTSTPSTAPTTISAPPASSSGSTTEIIAGVVIAVIIIAIAAAVLLRKK